MADEFVWLRHPDIDSPAQFAPGAADVWQQRGWQPCDPPAEVDPALIGHRPAQPEPEATPVAPKPTKTTTAKTEEQGNG